MGQSGTNPQDKAAECSVLPCKEPVWEDGKCLFHSPENGRDNETAQRVWEAAKRRAQSNPDYREWHFPADPSKLWFAGQHFRAPQTGDCVRFAGATFEDSASFRCAQFLSTVSFEGGTFTQPANFEHAKFKEDADFSKVTFCRESVAEAEVSFCHVEFHRRAKFRDTKFKAPALFDETVVKLDATFANARFREIVRFDRCTFRREADFAHAQFEGTAQFTNVSFMSNVTFRRAAFHQDADFSGSTPEDGIDVHFDLPPGILRPWKPKCFRKPQSGETGYRLAKQAALNRGDYAGAGNYHYWERCAAERGRRRKWGRKWLCSRQPWAWLREFVFGWMVFGYGERPGRALWIGALVVAVCALLYYGCGMIGFQGPGQMAYEPTPWESFYFSMVTFTTLGYGDFAPKPGFRWLASLEAASGAILMAVFVVGLTRKYIR